LVHFLRGKQTADLFSLSSLSQETFLFEFSRPVPVACEVLYQGGADFFLFLSFLFSIPRNKSAYLLEVK